jgi:hypothetical protein
MNELYFRCPIIFSRFRLACECVMRPDFQSAANASPVWRRNFLRAGFASEPIGAASGEFAWTPT